MVTDPTVELVMLEPTAGYFESLRHTMVGLQIKSSYRCLLSTYLFEPKPGSVSAPKYLREAQNGQPSIPSIVKSLDPSQYNAFNRATTEELALIQGPPGTGKTFTSNIILQSLVDTQCLPRSPIIVVAQTNHAVDQLMKKFINDRGSESVVRLGGRGSDEMKDFSLGQRMQTTRNFRGQSIGHYKAKLKKIISCLEEASSQAIREISAITLRGHGLLSAAQYDSLVDDDDWESSETQKLAQANPILTWLGNASLCSASSREQKEDQGLKPRQSDTKKICFVPLSLPPSRLPSEDYAKYLLDKVTNLYDIAPEQRPHVYQYLLTRLHGIVNPQSGVAKLLASYTATCKSMDGVRELNRVQFLQTRGFEVIACTATGLLKYRNIISGLRPQVLLMEEAAEIREADTIAACLRFPTLEHIILLGDHQQLQPHANLHELSKDPYRINISMFERLIKIGISHQTLLEQRRMIPRLRRIVQLFYPNVIDSPSITKLCKVVPGVLEPLWWFQHDWEETRSQSGSDSTSIENLMEARMIVFFVQYLVAVQKIHPARITVLTFYNGQVKLIKGELARNECLASHATTMEWSVRTVDGFQGEENDIILLSLVRGPNGVPGFLSSDNRAIVALSRARLGLYIFGHQDVLLKYPKSRQTWEKVIHDLGGHSGRAMPLRMNGEDVRVRNLDYWKQVWRKNRSTRPGAVGGQDSSSRSSSSALPSENEAKEDTVRVDARKRRSTREGKEKPLCPDSPPSAIAAAAKIATVEPDPDLISLTDSVTISLSQQPLDLGSMSFNTPVMALEDEDDDLLIQFSGGEDIFDAVDTTISSKPLIDLLD